MHGGWWWIDRWLKSSAYHILTLEEQGAYRNLLDQLWLRDGVLPNNDRVLGRMCGDALAWPRIKASILPYFRVTPDGLRHDTHDEIAEQSRKRADRQRRYRERHVTHNADNNAAHNAGHSPSPSPSPSPSLKEKKQTERAKKPRAQRSAPDDFTLTAERHAFAAKILTPDRVGHEWAKFHDYEFAVAHTDWDKVWRNWVRKASERRNGDARHSEPTPEEMERALAHERHMRRP